MLKNKRVLITTLITAFAVSCFSTVSQAEAPPDAALKMAEQMATFGGSMHAAARACGGYSEEQLVKMKQQQQEILAQRGMTRENFEKAYSAAIKKTEEKWQTLSDTEQNEACKEIKQQAGMMTQ